MNSSQNPTAYMNMLIALVSVNIRLILSQRNRVLWALEFIGSITPAVIAWWIVWWYADEMFRADIAEAYTVYSAISATLYMQLYVPLFALLMGLTLISSEVEGETLVYPLTRPVPRTLIVVGKFLAFLILSAVTINASLFCTFVILGTLPDADLWLYEWDILLLDMGVFTLGLAAYGAVLMCIGSLFKYRMIIGILLLFVWDTSAAFFPGSTHQFTVRHYLLSLFPHELAGDGGLIDMLTTVTFSSEPWSVFMLLMITTVFCGLTTFVIKFRELPMGQTET